VNCRSVCALCNTRRAGLSYIAHVVLDGISSSLDWPVANGGLFHTHDAQ
jgi:hypothetical protein